MALKSQMDQDKSSLHDFQPPGPNDIRGPCPGLNAAANHGYISRDGITTFDEIIQATQDVFNLGVDVATLAATIAIALVGDIRTGKLSIGRNPCDIDGLCNISGGLNTHNKFEVDASLTRSDYYLANGDDYTFNITLYRMMHVEAQKNGGLYNRTTLSNYRFQRYQQSIMENGNFIFLPQSFFLYIAAAFVYQLMPNGTDMLPTETVVSSFFGTEQNNDGQWISVPERIPPNWIKRKTPLTAAELNPEALAMYLENPVLFGGNIGGKPNTFFPGPIQLTADQQTPNGISCFLYQTILSVVASQVESGITEMLDRFNYLTDKLDPIFGKNFGCPSTSFNQTKTCNS